MKTNYTQWKNKCKFSFCVCVCKLHFVICKLCRDTFRNNGTWQIINEKREEEKRKNKKRKERKKNSTPGFSYVAVREYIICIFFSIFNLTDLQRILSVRLPMMMMPLIMLLLVLRIVLITFLLVLLRRDGFQNVIGSFLRDKLLTRTIHRIHCQAWILYHSVGSLCTIWKWWISSRFRFIIDALCIYLMQYAKQCLSNNPFKGLLSLFNLKRN